VSPHPVHTCAFQYDGQHHGEEESKSFKSVHPDLFCDPVVAILVVHTFNPVHQLSGLKVKESSECCQRDDTEKCKPPLRLPEGPWFEGVGWLQRTIHYGLA
jgi:hypothetical protein